MNRTYDPAVAPALASVPDYDLYGEPAGRGFPDVLHIETIAVRSGPRRWRIAPHRHKALHQVFWIASGGGTVRIVAENYPIENGLLINMPPRIVHGFRFAPQTEGVVVTVPEAVLAPVLKEVDLEQRLSHAVLCRGVAEPPWMMALMGEEHAGDRPHRAAALRAFAALVAVWCVRQIGTDARNLPGGTGAAALLARRFQALVEARFTTEHRVSAYAAELGVTPTHLSRVCRDCYGRSASALLRDRQMLEARRLIAYTQTGIGEIAYRLGFADAAYFTRVFTAETGQSPRAFRRAFTELPGGQ